jgi:hypothetical protein
VRFDADPVIGRGDTQGDGNHGEPRDQETYNEDTSHAWTDSERLLKTTNAAREIDKGSSHEEEPKILRYRVAQRRVSPGTITRWISRSSRQGPDDLSEIRIIRMAVIGAGQ